MLACVTSAAVVGLDVYPVHIEVDVSFGLPTFTVVGLPDVAVRESRDRVRAAIRNSGFPFPPHRITVNLAPADVRKGGSSFDLPIALAVLAASGVVTRHDKDSMVLGELSLDGLINPIPGVLPIAVAAQRAGIQRLFIPPQNAAEACLVKGAGVYTVGSLAEAVQALNDPTRVAPARPVPADPPAGPPEPDLAEVRGQRLPRRALEIAAAGGHNLLFVGPPGAGKTMLARRLPGILPPLTDDERLTCTAIFSVAGRLAPGHGLLAQRPFRAPHHTVSHVALVGGGSVPRPGEITLAHCGVLFLDEMPEFDRRVLEVLRQPMEDGQVTIARAARTTTFPARFQLVGAMNPCPCGFLGDERRPCRCTPQQVARYASRVSGPLRDRIDLIVDTPALPPDLLNDSAPGEPSSVVRERVYAARTVQHARAAETGCDTNADLRGDALRALCALDARGRRLLKAATLRLGLTARAYHRVLRVARTIADLAGTHDVHADHVAEALHYRGD